MNPFLGQPRISMIVNISLFVLFAGVVLGGVFFAGTALGESAFARPTPNYEGWSRMPPAKQTVLARGLYPTPNPNANAAPQVVRPSDLPTSAPGEMPSNLPHRTAGTGTIIDVGQAPLPATAYYVSNQWYASSGNEKFSVYAGGFWNGPHTDHSVGFVLVIYKSLIDDSDTRPSVMVQTPSPTGALKIVDATGMKLKLQSEQGVTHYFDVNAGKFVSQ